jgi:hypothetical protein
LAVIIPGGLAILALWLSFRAAKRRQALRANAERMSQPGRLSQPTPLVAQAQALPACCAAK